MRNNLSIDMLRRNSTFSSGGDIHGLPRRDTAPIRKPISGHGKNTAQAAENSCAVRESNVAKVEAMMLKGFSDSLMAGALGVAVSTVKRYAEKINILWETLGHPSNHRRARGKALRRLDLIQQRLWSLIDKDSDDQITLEAVDRLFQCHDRMLVLDGLTPEVVRKIDASGGQSQVVEV